MSLRSFVFSATKILLLIGLSFTSLETLYAGNTVSVIRGPQGSRITLNWNVVGGSAQCIGATNYPITADSINSGWTTGPLHAGTGNTDSIAGWGTNFLAAPKAAPGYQFTCTDNNSAKFDTAWLIVDDCNPGDVWNGTACVPAGPPVIGVSFKATPNPVAFNTSTVLSWAVTGIVTSCTLSGGQFGAGIPVGATDSRPTNNLVVVTTYT